MAAVHAADPLAATSRLGMRQAIEQTVTGLGYELVDIEREPRGLLRVSIDRVPGRSYLTGPSEFVTVEDCESVTRQLQYVLEVEAVDYARLEVSSPGLDRPLRQAPDFERFLGQAVAVTLKEPFQGRKTFKGVLGQEVAQDPGQGVASHLRQAAEQPSAVAALSDAPACWTVVFQDGKTEQVLAFTLDEVREARLVPVVDFKGRQGKRQDVEDGAAPASVPTSHGAEGDLG